MVIKKINNKLKEQMNKSGNKSQNSKEELTRHRIKETLTKEGPDKTWESTIGAPNCKRNSNGLVDYCEEEQARSATAK